MGNPTFARVALPLTEAVRSTIRNFRCCDEEDDPVAQNVQDFLTSFRFESGVEHRFSSTYLFVDRDLDPMLVGYVTLTLDSVRLTNSEKKRLGVPDFPDFGAIRIQMIGIDCRHQGHGYGAALLEAVTGLAKELSKRVAARFLLADGNVRKLEWYTARGFVPNHSERERERVDPERTVSLRLDLLEG